jgi:hypothetical protein
MEKLFESFSQLPEEERDIAISNCQRVLTGPKRPVTFSKDTHKDCIRTDGLALDLRYIEPISVCPPTLHIPEEIADPVPSDFLCEHINSVCKHIVMNNEKACRILIDNT